MIWSKKASFSDQSLPLYYTTSLVGLGVRSKVEFSRVGLTHSLSLRSNHSFAADELRVDKRLWRSALSSASLSAAWSAALVARSEVPENVFLCM
jgi:hypothetical protein